MSKKLPNQKTILISSGLAVTIVLGLVAAYLLNAGLPEKTSPETLNYDTILPESKTADELGGWRRVSPPDKDPVFAYTDSIDGTRISVSQQQLPADFKSNPDGQVAELAGRFNATDKIEIDDTTVHIGTSAQGPQSVILMKNNLLIMIKSEQKIDDKAWSDYIKTLN